MKTGIITSFTFVLYFSFLCPAFTQDKKDKLPPEATEVWVPEPRVVTPGALNHQPPSDAVVLFDGTSLDNWKSADKDAPAPWKVENGYFQVVPKTGGIETKASFGDVQLHIEWKAPAEIKGSGQGRGNSGLFFMGGRYEVQILDSYNNRTYSNGQAGSVYKQHIPLVNAMRPPSEWNTYDVVFMAPRFNADGVVVAPARVTVFHNGVLVQNNAELKGNTEYIGIPQYQAHASELPITLQDHGDLVSFRNIWVRKL
ncbi:MAG: 3-keto-disaccharide hydrolase [Saprospiraceae bacterium]